MVVVVLAAPAHARVAHAPNRVVPAALGQIVEATAGEGQAAPARKAVSTYSPPLLVRGPVHPGRGRVPAGGLDLVAGVLLAVASFTKTVDSFVFIFLSSAGIHGVGGRSCSLSQKQGSIVETNCFPTCLVGDTPCHFITMFCAGKRTQAMMSVFC